MSAAEPAPPICERCWSPIRAAEQFVRLGSIAHASLRGDVTWNYTYLHPYGAGGCVSVQVAS